MTKRLITPLFLAALAIGVAAPGSPTARIRCGVTITKHTKLRSRRRWRRPAMITAAGLALVGTVVAVWWSSGALRTRTA
ncbi:MAG: hypothetical protein ACRDMH_12280 [Solirubrobacterales bacterium]